MTKKYNLGNKSDIKHFKEDLMGKVHSIVEDTVMERDVEIECPHCHKKVSVPKGFSYCPKCHGAINTDIKVRWK